MPAEASLRDRRRALLAEPGLRGEDFCRRYAAEADQWLSSLAERVAGEATRHLALVAVGGYGRGSLCPYSDLDVVLVHDGHRDIKEVADAIWYPVWDEGVHLDHSVRRPSEVLTAAAEDVRVALGLLDARRVWGETKVADPLIEKARDAWRSQLGTKYLPVIEAQMAERRATHGDVAFLLEPDLKESHGGLRDAGVLRGLSFFAPLLADYADLESLEPATSLLTTIRVELHRLAGRAQDRLLLQDQDQIADVLSFPDADALMAAVSEAGRTIAWVSDDVWRRRRLWDPTPVPRRRFLRGRSAHGADGSAPIDLGEDLVEINGEIALAPTAAVSTDSSLAFRLAAVAAERDRPIARGSLHRLADRMPPPPDPWPAEVRHALVRLLATGRPAIRAMESIDQHGLLVRVLPEWAAVRNKPQRNAYHTYTVDRHLLEAVALAAELQNRVERPDLLLIGALLHDIGKGFPGDHTEVGMQVVETVASRMGFSPADVDVLVSMVRHHLLLPDTATRRDLDDPTTITNVAQAAGDRITLSLLGALTEADSRATGPSAWGPWKAGLVTELVNRADRVLAGEQVASGPDMIIESHREMMEEVRQSGQPSVELDPPYVVVAGPDRRGLFSSVAGVLALHRLDVRAANVSGEDGVAVEVFTVEVPRGTWPDTAKLRRDLVAVLSGELAVGERLSERESQYPVRRRAARTLDSDVGVDNDASQSATVLEVRAPDEVGLLHRITTALFEADLDVVSARVSTLGELVVDAFYVRESSGGKITDLGRLDTIRDAVSASLTS